MPDADSTFPEIGAGAPQRRRPAASPQPVHKPQLGANPRRRRRSSRRDRVAHAM